MLLVIDNYDSFTFNLVQYFGQLGVSMRIFRNDELTPAADLHALHAGVPALDDLADAEPERVKDLSSKLNQWWKPAGK